MGYIKAGSRESLIAGVGLGAILLIGAVLHFQSGNTLKLIGLVLGLLASVAAAGRFLPLLLQEAKMPAIMMAPMGIVGAVLCIVSLIQTIRSQ